MNVYKISEINEDNVKEHLKFDSPELKVNHYFINCNTNLFIQLEHVHFSENFYEDSEKIMANIHIQGKYEKNMLVFDNLIINTVNDMFPLWFNKEIDMVDLLEYYTPSVNNYEDNENEDNDDDEDDEDDGVVSDIFSYTSSEDEVNEVNEVNEEEVNEVNEDSIDLCISCVVPYNYEEDDLDIMIYDSSNNLIDKLWNEVELMNKSGICIIKLSGLKIEKDKFSSIWELIQLKII